MFKDFTGADKVYIACGYTDIRKGIDGLATMVQSQFDLNPFTNTYVTHFHHLFLREIFFFQRGATECLAS